MTETLLNCPNCSHAIHLSEALTAQMCASGDDFRQKVAAIVGAVPSMREQLERERRATKRFWKEREKQFRRILTSTAGIYGELRALSDTQCDPSRSLNWMIKFW